MNWTPRCKQAEWHLTYKCNLRCVGCNRLAMRPNHTPDMTLADAEKFCRQARSLNWKPLVVIIGGEPTLHPDLDGFIDLAYDLSRIQVHLFSNGYSQRSKEILDKYRADPRVLVCELQLKTDGSVTHLYQDYHLAPCDIGKEREPCINHSAYRRDDGGCGISVDANGYTVCAIGGTIDGLLGLGVRTNRLASLFDAEFAAKQTKALCSRCGVRWGADQHFDNVTMVDGARMSPTWAEAVRRSRNGD